MILACNNITKSFGEKEILHGVSFHINDNEKAAIVGINGAGKSTLFKIIVGELSSDAGEVIFSKGSTYGYLSQHQDLTSENTIYEELLSTKADILKLEESIRSLEQEMKHMEGEALDQALSSYSRMNHEFEIQNGYAYRSEVVGILKGLGFEETEFEKCVNTLSGGQKTRIALGKLLLRKPDLILLDEPTNHLDMNSIAWLETFLATYKGAVVVIAHDRYFLDKVVTKVVELDHTKAQTFEGNYSTYADKKAKQREDQIKAYLNQQREIKHQEEVITKLRSFNREKSIKRAESREKMLDKIERLDKPMAESSGMNIRLEPSITSGNDVLSVTGLSKSFGPQTLFTDLSFEIKRGEKVAIIGNNGTGKTTILKMINGIVTPDAGDIRPGVKVHIAYYDQEHQVLHMEKTLFSELQDTYPFMDNTQIRNTLAAFLFTGDDVFKQIKDISGGERGRVSLAKLMLSESNFLILDEPTNHLDIMSKEILENAIQNYTGTVLYVSHDRYFINKTATKILDLTNGRLIPYQGNYDYYLEHKENMERIHLQGIGYGVGKTPASSGAGKTATPSLPSAEPESAGKQDWKQQKEEQAKQRKRQNDLKRIEAEIERLEARSEELDVLLADEAVYTNHTKLLEVTKEKDETAERLLELMEQWEELAD
ncbi:MAG: ABC-F family ATP-binding cassette domain-containing protein [Lachnospiraceae bacterium]|nr:ABC-F family ATP-binding cassette domain-containing protein [Lachnospiraceae bacterium]